MSFNDWQSQPSTSTGNQEFGFICMSTTVDDLSYTPSDQERSRDAAQIVVTGRRSWKTLKGKGEAVWPPNLEASLLEALEKYDPEAVGSKSTKTLGRFPMRNRFISDYIYEQTGKRRSPKQVGSRLQQLRDTCKGDKILQLISHHGTPEASSSASSHSEGSVDRSPSPQSSASVISSNPRNTSTSRTLVTYVEVSFNYDIWRQDTPSIHFIQNTTHTPQKIQLSISPTLGDPTQDKSLALPFSLPTVRFTSTSPVSLESSCYVYNGHSSPIHTEIVPLKCVSSPMQSSAWLYSSELVPQFWDRLYSSGDPSQYTILQNLRLAPVNSGGSTLQSHDRQPRISVAYKFVGPHTSQEKRVSELAYRGPSSNTTPSIGHNNMASNYRSYPSLPYVDRQSMPSGQVDLSGFSFNDSWASAGFPSPASHGHSNQDLSNGIHLPSREVSQPTYNGPRISQMYRQPQVRAASTLPNDGLSNGYSNYSSDMGQKLWASTPDPYQDQSYR